FHFALHNGVRLAQNRQSLRRDLPQYANGKTRPGEWLPINDLFRQAKLQTRLAHFVFEQLPQRFDQLEIHFFWQPTDVVMTLDYMRGIPSNRHTFDYVGVKRALREKAELMIGNGGSILIFCKIDDCVFEHADELVADDFAFLLRISDTAQFRQEPF